MKRLKLPDLIGTQGETVAMATASESYLRGFVELEIVLARFGDGAFSIFSSADATGDERNDGTKFYPKAVDGMNDFRARFDRQVGGAAFGFGLKLVLAWP